MDVTLLDEPVRRYLGHAVLEHGYAARGTRLEMRGRIKVGRWLPFTATWEGNGRRFEWRARAARGLLRVVDRFADGAGAMDVRLLGRVPLVRASDEDTTRSAAGRAAIEGAMWAPGALAAMPGVAWQAVADDEIVATWDVPPERPAVRLWVDEHGAVRRSVVERWDDGAHGRHGYIPCGADVHAERRFGAMVLPSRVTVGWWYGTPRFEPFFEAELLRAQPLGG